MSKQINTIDEIIMKQDSTLISAERATITIVKEMDKGEKLILEIADMLCDIFQVDSNDDNTNIAVDIAGLVCNYNEELESVLSGAVVPEKYLAENAV